MTLKPSFQPRSVRINPRSELSESIRINPRSESESESIQGQNPNPNQSKVGMIRIDSDWKFGLDKSELRLIRIDLYWKHSFGLVQIHSDWFWLTRYEFQSDIFTRKVTAMYIQKIEREARVLWWECVPQVW